jgi:hypothetical protein
MYGTRLFRYLVSFFSKFMGDLQPCSPYGLAAPSVRDNIQLNFRINKVGDIGLDLTD